MRVFPPIRLALRFYISENEREIAAEKNTFSFCQVRIKVQLNGFSKISAICGNNKTAKRP